MPRLGHQDLVARAGGAGGGVLATRDGGLLALHRHRRPGSGDIGGLLEDGEGEKVKATTEKMYGGTGNLLG